jgi:hypothetical protein
MKLQYIHLHSFFGNVDMTKQLKPEVNIEMSTKQCNCLTVEDGTDTLSRNVGEELAFDAVIFQKNADVINIAVET